jgi:hypothetical protein
MATPMAPGLHARATVWIRMRILKNTKYEYPPAIAILQNMPYHNIQMIKTNKKGARSDRNLVLSQYNNGVSNGVITFRMCVLVIGIYVIRRKVQPRLFNSEM